MGIGGCSGVGARGEALEEGVNVSVEALRDNDCGCFGTAFAASAHGGDVRKSCGSGHGVM